MDDVRGQNRQTSTIDQPQGSYLSTFNPFVDVWQNAAIQHFGPSFNGTVASPAGAGGVGIKQELIIRPCTINVFDPLDPSLGGLGIHPRQITTLNLSETPVMQRDYGSANILENKSLISTPS